MSSGQRFARSIGVILSSNCRSAISLDSSGVMIVLPCEEGPGFPGPSAGLLHPLPLFESVDLAPGEQFAGPLIPELQRVAAVVEPGPLVEHSVGAALVVVPEEALDGDLVGVADLDLVGPQSSLVSRHFRVPLSLCCCPSASQYVTPSPDRQG